MPLFQPSCPAMPRQRLWVDDSFNNFNKLGHVPVQQTVLLPTADFFPIEDWHDLMQLQILTQRLCHHMRVDPHRVEIDYSVSDVPPLADTLRPDIAAHQPPATCHQLINGRTLITLAEAQMDDPPKLVARIGHYLAHEVLTHQAQIPSGLDDAEGLADLLAIYCGFGVFIGNAGPRFAHLAETTLGYALARHASMRQEPDPEWAGHLNQNVRHYVRKSQKWISWEARSRRQNA